MTGSGEKSRNRFLRHVVAVAVVATSIAGLPSPAFGWETTLDFYDGTRACKLKEKNAEGLTIEFLSSEDTDPALIAVSIYGLAQSFKVEEAYDGFELGTENGRFGRSPFFGLSNGIMTILPTDALDDFADSGAGEDETLYLVKDGRPLASFPLAGMRDRYVAFKACGALELELPIAQDPFRP